jgi:hypothetical protein
MRVSVGVAVSAAVRGPPGSPACLAEALRQAWRRGRALTWESVSGQLSALCTGAVDYAEHISR